MNKKMKLGRNKGITLVALIITIIVLLILAAVTIRAVTGGNGILAHAKNARAKWEEATANEEAMLGNLVNQIQEGVESENQSDGTSYEIIDVELKKGNYVNYHYKGESGADTFISCMCVGEEMESYWTEYRDVCWLFPLSTLEDLSFYPPSGEKTIEEAQARWKSVLGADYVVNGAISKTDVLNLLKELGIAKSYDNKSYLANTPRSTYQGGKWNVISENGDWKLRSCVDTMTDSYLYVSGGFRPFVILDKVEFGVLDNGKKGTSVVDAYDLVLK